MSGANGVNVGDAVFTRENASWNVPRGWGFEESAVRNFGGVTPPDASETCCILFWLSLMVLELH